MTANSSNSTTKMSKPTNGKEANQEKRLTVVVVTSLMNQAFVVGNEMQLSQQLKQ